jgi:hypothetical protein
MFGILKSAIILEKSMSNIEGGLLAIMRSCGPDAGRAGQGVAGILGAGWQAACQGGTPEGNEGVPRGGF